MPRINRLTTSVINKIAAGEVIERPASVVKELVENSVDAGSTRIDVSVEKGGLDAIRVVDNGCGVAPEDLPLAVASHATSKLLDADDLFRVGTLGFRGEALASIAEVSRFEIASREPQADAGARLEVVAGQLTGPTPCAAPPGTAIDVGQLFFNTPVRRKFMKSPQTEMGHVSEAFSRIALAHPGIHFTLRHGGRTLFDLPPVERWSERIVALYGRELESKLIWVESRDASVRLSGYVCHPSESRSHNRLQYLLLNGRFIRDRALQHALAEAYRGLLITGRFPVAFLRLEMPADLVDVNVHPTKLEVRFQDGGRLYSQLLGTLRTRFLSIDLNHPLVADHAREAAATAAPAPAAVGHEAESGWLSAAEERRLSAARDELANWAKNQLDPAAPAVTNPAELPSPASWTPPEEAPAELPWRQRPLELVKLERDTPAFGPDRPTGLPLRPSAPVREVAARLLRPASEVTSAPAAPTEDEAAAGESLAQARASGSDAAHAGATRGAIQVYNRYLIAETGEGVVIIDQHALHEKVLYEQLRDRALAGQLESQRLLVPEVVDLSAQDAASALEHRETLQRLGLGVEPFGEHTLLVTSCPAMLRQCHPGELLRELVEKLAAGGQQLNQRDVLDELLHMMSCKAAIKAGDPLTPEEIEALLELRHLAQDPHHCPHGRPTSLVFTRDDLDRQFKRI